MGIVRKPSSNRLFDSNPSNPSHVIHDELTPRVHNKHHGTAPKDAVYIGRGSPWGNPYVIGKHGTREEVIERYRQVVLPTLDLTPLRGKHLLCFCKPAPCHGDLLLEAANK